MAKPIKALVEPTLLIWARESASLSLEEAARSLNISEAQLTSWETGVDRPTVKQLIRLAEVYKRPMSVFYLPEPPQNFQALRDFRRLPFDQPRQLSRQLAFEVRAAQERRLIALEVFEALGEQPPLFPLEAHPSDNPAEIAARMRDFLGVTISQQQSWRSPEVAYREWREAIEGIGVLVFALSGPHHRVNLDEARGFAFADRPLPVIVINGKDRHNGRIFTMMHELGHIVLGQSILENTADVGDWMPPEDRAIEAFCNKFAASLLMPEAFLRADPIVLAHRSGIDWDEESIQAVAARFSVSREALLFRLAGFGLVRQAFARERAAAYAAQYREQDEQQAVTGPIAIPYQRQVLSHVGRGFSRLVLQGYHAQQITLNRASEYLGMQAKYVAPLERDVFARGR
jgi:Zn-dependent peptidase ImmA (M78 family)/transcriptional regulator with XRE-family HTH domain